MVRFSLEELLRYGREEEFRRKIEEKIKEIDPIKKREIEGAFSEIRRIEIEAQQGKQLGELSSEYHYLSRIMSVISEASEGIKPFFYGFVLQSLTQVWKKIRNPVFEEMLYKRGSVENAKEELEMQMPERTITGVTTLPEVYGKIGLSKKDLQSLIIIQELVFTTRSLLEKFDAYVKNKKEGAINLHILENAYYSIKRKKLLDNFIDSFEEGFGEKIKKEKEEAAENVKNLLRSICVSYGLDKAKDFLEYVGFSPEAFLFFSIEDALRDIFETSEERNGDIYIYFKETAKIIENLFKCANELYEEKWKGKGWWHTDKKYDRLKELAEKYVERYKGMVKSKKEIETQLKEKIDKSKEPEKKLWEYFLGVVSAIVDESPGIDKFYKKEE